MGACLGFPVTSTPFPHPPHLHLLQWLDRAPKPLSLTALLTIPTSWVLSPFLGMQKLWGISWIPKTSGQ